MSSIESYRKEIENIDEQLIKLFKQRMSIVKAIAKYKKENNLPVLDKVREDKLLITHLDLLADEDIASCYTLFFEGLMSSSRLLQHKLND